MLMGFIKKVHLGQLFSHWSALSWRGFVEGVLRAHRRTSTSSSSSSGWPRKQNCQKKTGQNFFFFRWTKFVSWFLVFNWNRFSLKIRVNLLGRGTPTLYTSKLMSNKLNKNKVFGALSVIVFIIIIYYLIKFKIINIFGRNCSKKITLNSLAQ